MPHHFLDDVAWADEAFVAQGRSLPELFESAARALAEAQVDDLGAIRGEETREVRLESESADGLLHAFLEELVFLKDAERFIVGGVAARITEREGRWNLDASVTGDTIDPTRHKTVVDVKAITWHRFEVARTPEGGWRAQVVLDV